MAEDSNSIDDNGALVYLETSFINSIIDQNIVTIKEEEKEDESEEAQANNLKRS